MHRAIPALTRLLGKAPLWQLAEWAAICFGSGETPFPTVNQTVTHTLSGTTRRTGNAWFKIMLQLSTEALLLLPRLRLRLSRLRRHRAPRNRLAAAPPCMASVEAMDGPVRNAAHRELVDIVTIGTRSVSLHEALEILSYKADTRIGSLCT